MNYKKEIYHDNLLISLVEDLNTRGELDIVRQAFNIENNLGQLRLAKRRRDFDVELTFSNLSVVIETKVDSDEDGRKNGRQIE